MGWTCPLRKEHGHSDLFSLWNVGHKSRYLGDAMSISKKNWESYKKPTEEKMDALIKLLRESKSAYWCKWCNQHIPRQKDANVFIHDKVYHPTGWIPECGGEHKIQ